MSSIVESPGQSQPSADLVDRAVGREMVRITGLTKTFQRKREDVPVLKGIDLSIAEGELLVLLGPSGCGKTTLLRCLVGLETPTSGAIVLDDKTVVDASTGRFVHPDRRDVGMVFQNYALWPHMKVRDNVAYPLKARKLKDALKSGRVQESLDVVQCGHLGDRYPPELSGGQQQRVALARALAPQPALMLLDEPLSNLDALLRIDLRAQLRHLHREMRFTGVYVTHDQDEAMALGTRVAVMNEGQFEQIGDPLEVYMRPATEYVADFLGARNNLPVDVAAGAVTIDGHRAELGGPVPDGQYRLRIRPERVSVQKTGALSSAGGQGQLPGVTVEEVIPVGEQLEFMLRLGEHVLYARQGAESYGAESPRVGDEVAISWRHQDGYLYGADGGTLVDQ